MKIIGVGVLGAALLGAVMVARADALSGPSYLERMWANQVEAARASAERKAREDDRLTDRVDEACSGRRAGEVCTVGGAPETGAGTGQCVREFVGLLIHMYCDVDLARSSAARRGGASGAAPSPLLVVPYPPWPPRERDPACTGKREGGSCQLLSAGAEGRIIGSVSGACKATTEAPARLRGQSRTVVQCVSNDPPRERRPSAANPANAGPPGARN